MWKLDRTSEFEIHARMFCLLKDAGIDVRGEVKFKGPGVTSGLIADLLILVNNEPCLVLEVKPLLNEFIKNRTDYRFYKRKTGVRCVLVDHKDIPTIVERTKKYINTYSSRKTKLNQKILEPLL
jgi:hypothetical protein